MRRFAIFLAIAARAEALARIQPSITSLWTARISQSGRCVGLRGFPVADEKPGPCWANRINSALELAPMATVVAFIMIDIGSAAILLSILMALNIRVPSDFALAYTVCKGALRVPRLALDASGAALLARHWPALASIRVSLMIDAATRGGTSSSPTSMGWRTWRLRMSSVRSPSCCSMWRFARLGVQRVSWAVSGALPMGSAF